MKLRNFQKQSGLSNDECLRDMSIHFCCALAFLRERKCLVYSVFLYRRGLLALSVLLFRAMRRPHLVELTKLGSTLFLCPLFYQQLEPMVHNRQENEGYTYSFAAQG